MQLCAGFVEVAEPNGFARVGRELSMLEAGEDRARHFAMMAGIQLGEFPAVLDTHFEAEAKSNSGDCRT